jgi:acetyl/propionyl-CoA carboxylase alpha subunit
MAAALDETVILGIKTPVAFLRAIVTHEAFLAGRTSTAFLKTYFEDWAARPSDPDGLRLALAAAAYAETAPRSKPRYGGDGRTPESTPSPWASLGPWRLGGD